MYACTSSHVPVPTSIMQFKMEGGGGGGGGGGGSPTTYSGQLEINKRGGGTPWTPAPAMRSMGGSTRKTCLRVLQCGYFMLASEPCS